MKKTDYVCPILLALSLLIPKFKQIKYYTATRLPRVLQTNIVFHLSWHGLGKIFKLLFDSQLLPRAKCVVILLTSLGIGKLSVM
jgi:hypothetical protein